MGKYQIRKYPENKYFNIPFLNWRIHNLSLNFCCRFCSNLIYYKPSRSFVLRLCLRSFCHTSQNINKIKMVRLRVFIYFSVLFSLLHCYNCYNKYSKEANVEKNGNNNQNPDFRPVSLKHLDRPFRMAKLNLLWSKAVIVSLVNVSINYVIAIPFFTAIVWT